MSKTFLWIEDKKNKSGYTFWKTFTEQLFPDVIVESKKNNSELVKAVKRLKIEKTDILWSLIIPLIIFRFFRN